MKERAVRPASAGRSLPLPERYELNPGHRAAAVAGEVVLIVIGGTNGAPLDLALGRPIGGQVRHLQIQRLVHGAADVDGLDVEVLTFDLSVRDFEEPGWQQSDRKSVV